MIPRDLVDVARRLGRIGDVIVEPPYRSVITGPAECYESPFAWCARYPVLHVADREDGGLAIGPATLPLWCLDPEDPAFYDARLIAAADAWSCWATEAVHGVPDAVEVPCPMPRS